MDTGAPGLTLVFLCVVGALATALVGLFCALERSEQMTRWRTAAIQRVDQRLRRNR